MNIPDWRTLGLLDGILHEPGAADDRLVLWLPGPRDDSFHHWERVATVPGAAVSSEQGIGAVAATLIPARQAQRGFFGKLLSRFRDGGADNSWVLPSGETAQQHGQRQNDLVLAWSIEDAPLDEARARARWPEGKAFRQLGQRLLLVSGIGPRAARTMAGPPPDLAEGQPVEMAEQLLAEARKSGDPEREATALTDLGIFQLRKGEAAKAVATLEQALAAVRRLGDKSREADVLGNLGVALLNTGQAARAHPLFEEQLSLARAAGDRVQEKLGLEFVGHSAAVLGDPRRALALYEQALGRARDLGDRAHEADLLWYEAIQSAEMGQRDEALRLGQNAIDLLRKMGNPAADLLTDHLHKYRLGQMGSFGGGNSGVMTLGGSIVAGAWASPSSQGQAQATGPGLLRMGMSAAKSIAKFIGSGLKTSSAEAHKRRLQTCGACEHHTGLRCKVCGCFTQLKAKLQHEACPLGKWPV